MGQNIRQIILCIGFVLIFVSFLFFGRKSGTYMILISLGLLISFVSYLVLLFSKKSRKTKIIWTLIVLFAAGIEYVVEPLLIKSSYLIYVKSNADELKLLNDILTKHDGDIDISRDTIISKSSHLTSTEIHQLKSLREKVDAYIIWKSNSDIYYGLYGFLDVRLGIVYIFDSDNMNKQKERTHLTENWYY